MDSHILAHKLETDELRNTESQVNIEELNKEAVEDLYFKELRQKYGFEDRVRDPCEKQFIQTL